MTYEIPVPGDFTSPDETIVHHRADVVPDDLGRFQFVAFWLTDQEWVPNGVRGKVFNTSLDVFTARQSGPVRVVTV
jgi:hypothetical protein